MNTERTGLKFLAIFAGAAALVICFHKYVAGELFSAILKRTLGD
jgi:hypothetical protein